MCRNQGLVSTVRKEAENYGAAAATVENSMEAPQMKNRILKRYLHPMFAAASVTIVKTWKPPKCPTTDEWTEKAWNIPAWK